MPAHENLTALAMREKYEKDFRFRQIIMAAVANVIADNREYLRGEIEIGDVHDIAVKSAATALSMAFDSDAELVNTRIERDHYKKMMSDALVAFSLDPLRRVDP